MPASGTDAIAVCCLARKFCTITSWTCPNSLCDLRIACSVSARSVSVSPMPTSSPVVNGIDSRPASVRRPQPHLGILVRTAVVRKAFRLEQPPRRGLQHHAHRRRDRLQPRQLRPAHHAGVQVRQQPGLLEHPDRHRPHVVQRGVVAALVQPLPGLRPPRLGSVAESEQRFLATQFGARGARHRGSRRAPCTCQRPAPRSLPGTVTNVQ